MTNGGKEEYSRTKSKREGVQNKTKNSKLEMITHQKLTNNKNEHMN